ncbi:hypothetical protein BX666DRAFT_2024395 [Dichotomocladium elegans]|nr:hypothetical protein BX666DRAFT_2024395 [Dichotomocladium elegans]
MASFLAVIYDTHLGIDHAGIQKRVQQTAAPAVQAVNDAEAAMAYCRDEVLPELDVLDHTVVRPILELKEIVKTIQKTIVKRNHKLIDYDRHRSSAAKLKTKEERSFNEEKQLYKVEDMLQKATEDYNYLNDMLKTELPRFFHLKAMMIEPLLEHFYNMQCKIYGMIYARCYELVDANQNYFVTHAMSIEDGYNWQKSQRDGQAEMENLDLLKSGGKAWLKVSGGETSSKMTLKERAALRKEEDILTAQLENGGSGINSHAGVSSGHMSPSPPVYTAASAATTHSYATTPNGYPIDKKPAAAVHQYATPVPVAPRSNKTLFVRALYDYDAQTEGDLSFKKDDKIEVIQRTDDQDDWWTGKLCRTSETGIFPGNYVAIL